MRRSKRPEADGRARRKSLAALVALTLLAAQTPPALAGPDQDARLDPGDLQNAVPDAELERNRGGTASEAGGEPRGPNDRVSVILWDEAPRNGDRGGRSTQAVQTRSQVGGAQFE